MGSRSRSVRLRMYFLVTIPLVAMAGLLAYVAGTSVRNAINLDRAPNLINATSLPTAVFTSYLQDERAAAVSYLFAPTPANLAAYRTAVTATSQHTQAFRAAMTSPATVSSETPSEAAAINAALANLGKLGSIRAAVTARAIRPIVALTDYSQGIAAEPGLFLTEANSETDAAAVGQALGLIATVQAREQLSQEWALLGGMLAGNRMTRIDRVTIAEAAATRQADLSFATSMLTPANLATYNAGQAGSAAAVQRLAAVEQALAGGANVGQLPTTQAQWQQTAGTLLQDYYNGGVALAGAELVSDHQFGRSAWIRVAVTSGIALLGLLVTIVMTTLVAHGIIRRLRGLERSALTLAEQQLPDVIGRLRRGEDVDVAQEAPPLQAGFGPNDSGASGRMDEIGRVGRSFDLVRQTAIRAAVDEAGLRRGLNDVFRSLARRSQSLLHRQLTLLDQMERRTTDPEALDDLFRLDHLTTRMRRHAEGLVILAGAPPSRGWSNPVRMVDVMRGAIAEVEDYARVTVATRSQSALSGPAVADVIHLLAELIENATTLSPPYTPVRVFGDTVASGFAIEVEDRGLGISPERLAEFNQRLARPPEFNPADSEQLGLFVVSQLARRHSIQVTLKASPYGGITAVALIPPHLVVTEAAIRAGLPGVPAAIAIARGQDDRPELTVRAEPVRAEPVRAELTGAESTMVDLTGDGPARGGARPGRDASPAFDVFLPRHRSQGPAQPSGQGAGEPAIGVRSSYLASPAAGAGPPGPAGPAGPLGPAGPGPAAGSRPYLDPGLVRYPAATPVTPAATPVTPAATPVTPAASPAPDPVSVPPWELSSQTGPLPVVPGDHVPGDHVPGDHVPGDHEPGLPGPGDGHGLPRRVRQASLAPQLRADPPPRRVTLASSGPAAERSPADIGRSMSALQRGWQEGRAQPAGTGEDRDRASDVDAHGNTDGT